MPMFIPPAPRELTEVLQLKLEHYQELLDNDNSGNKLYRADLLQIIELLKKMLHYNTVTYPEYMAQHEMYQKQSMWIIGTVVGLTAIAIVCSIVSSV